jgi:RNA polymerase sigma-70 factor (ECF subfamily)
MHVKAGDPEQMSTLYLNGTVDVGSTRDNPRRRDDFRGLDESALIAAAQAGNSEAFEALVQPNSKNVLRSIRRITRNREDAEDALQDAFLKAFTHIKSFGGKSKFSTWLTRIAINSALMTVRSNRSTLASRMESYDDKGRGGLKAFPDQAPNPEAVYLHRERGVLIRRAIRALSPTIRQALQLQKVHELSVKETADRMGISISATKSRLMRARVDLKKALSATSF